MKRQPSTKCGFTLIEICVVVSIIAVVAAISVPVVGGMRRQSEFSREIASARQLMGAYHAYATDHDGELLPGYGNFPAKDAQGEELHGPAASRYPWRLAPYFSYDMRLLWGGDRADLERMAGGPAAAYNYSMSVRPSLGVNALFVGGDYQSLPPDKDRTVQRYGAFCVTRAAQAFAPAKQIVFASAGATYEGKPLRGYFKVAPPRLQDRQWATSPTGKPDDSGHVDFRWDGKAVVAMLDGHVEALGWEELEDMRRWSTQAAELDREDWNLGDQP